MRDGTGMVGGEETLVPSGASNLFANVRAAAGPACAFDKRKKEKALLFLFSGFFWGTVSWLNAFFAFRMTYFATGAKR
jgi:hypothetical protein